MASVAKSVVDVILGEAKAGSFRDMLGIASVIANRANSLSVDPQSVVSAKGEFAAYGKPLPAGVERYRDLAQKAIDEVAQRGPITDAQFYAKSSATKNLPKGLSFAIETDGHRYFTDPQARSIRTADGFRTPSLISPAVAAIDRISPANQNRALGLASLVPGYNPDARETLSRTNKGILSALDPNTDLESRPLSKVIDVSQYNPNAGRSLMPSSNIVDDVQMAVTKHFGPEYSVGIFSGQEPPGRAPVNSPNNHPGGWAVDFDVVSPDGSRLDMTNPAHAAALTQVQRDLAAQGHAIGYGEGYMAPGRTHAGSPPGSPVVGWGWNSSKSSMDPGLYAQLAEAKATGFNLPDQGPVPQSRPAANIAGDPVDTLYSPNAAETALSPEERDVSNEYSSREGILGNLPSVSARDASTDHDGILAGLPGAVPPDNTATSVAAPSVLPASQSPADLASQYGLLGSTMKQGGILGLDGRTAPVDQAVKASTPVPTYESLLGPQIAKEAPTVVPALSPPVTVRSVPQPAMAQSVATPTQERQAVGILGTGLDVWNGNAREGIATNGDRLTRNDDGTITRESAKYGWTQQMDNVGNIIGGSGAKNPISGLLGPLGGIISNAPVEGTKEQGVDFGHMARGAMGGFAGGMIGGLLGPIGGVIGSLLGAHIAQGKSPMGILGGTITTPGRNTGYSVSPGLGFPSAPQTPDNPGNGQLTPFGEGAAAGLFGEQAGYAANNPGKGLW